MIPSLFRLVVFTLYFATLVSLPLGILWGMTGLVAGTALWLGGLIALGYRAPTRIAEQLKAKPLAKGEAPLLFHLTNEISRRMGVPTPTLWSFASKVPNAALFGFTRSRAHLVLTEESLQLKRPELIALVSRAMAPLSQGDLLSLTWLSIFLQAIDSLIQLTRGKNSRGTPLSVICLQIVLYPVSLLPLYILGRSTDRFELDEASVRLSRQPLGLSELYRKIERALQTQDFAIPISTFHLFVAEPRRPDIIAGILFKPRTVGEQIDRLNPLVTTGVRA